MNDIEILDKLLNSEEKVVCLLAPSFVAQFEYPDFVYQLRSIGFDTVLELTFGAKMVNYSYRNLLKEDHSKTWISSACPTIVSLVKNKFPHLIPNLVPVLSPMGAAALISDKHFRGYKKVFVGPCLAKKLEAKELGTVDHAVTFKEIEEYIKSKNLPVLNKHKKTFDKFYNDYTKIYPLSGSIKDTLNFNHVLEENEILVEDGIPALSKVLEQFEDGKYKNIIFLDVLSCPGGCIGGPGISSANSIDDRKARVIAYKNYAQNYEKDLGRTGKIEQADSLDFSRMFQ